MNGYVLQVGYFDLAGGPLTTDPSNDIALPDGCLGQIVEDVDDDGLSAPTADGIPGNGDRLLIAGNEDSRRANAATFRLNGTERFARAGLFITEPRFENDSLPQHSIALRVWNASSAEEATGYWDSPMYRVLRGPQQVSFLHNEWTFHEVVQPVEDADDDSPQDIGNPSPLAQSRELLVVGPNPFNSSTRIRLNLDQAAWVRLNVYDVQGRLVRNLADHTFSAGGHELTFDGEAFPAGTYFLYLKAGTQAAVIQKLLLIR